MELNVLSRYILYSRTLRKNVGSLFHLKWCYSIFVLYFFQCALLYTTIYGERRIRVTTLSLSCTNMLSNLFRAADLDSQFACMLKQGRPLFSVPIILLYVLWLCNNICVVVFFDAAANEIPSKALPLVKEQATNSCINALYAYRKFCATVTSTGQLILPEALKLFPLYTLGIFLRLFLL